jgi:hypothetical protein
VHVVCKVLVNFGLMMSLLVVAFVGLVIIFPLVYPAMVLSMLLSMRQTSAWSIVCEQHTEANQHHPSWCQWPLHCHHLHPPQRRTASQQQASLTESSSSTSPCVVLQHELFSAANARVARVPCPTVILTLVSPGQTKALCTCTY